MSKDLSYVLSFSLDQLTFFGNFVYLFSSYVHLVAEPCPRHEFEVSSDGQPFPPTVPDDFRNLP